MLVRRPWTDWYKFAEPAGYVVAAGLAMLFLDQPLAWACWALPEPVHAAARWLSLLASFPFALGLSMVLVAVYFIRVFALEKTRISSLHAVFVAMSVMGTWFLAHVLKMLFGRMRPLMLFEHGQYGFTWFRTGYDYNSFPSGHAAIAFGLWLALAALRPRYRLLFIAAAVLLASTRVLTAAHFVSDVVFSALLAAATIETLLVVFRNRGMEIGE
ncbi:MAG: phosphatase PAP2 family protein [candidate division WOR-3 bacterium]|nr:MAG: phosphatase PAP2 family protein [candidate division WOR-3 bacterium]